MSDPKDRLFRHLAILRLIPRAPRSICTIELLERLKAEQFDIDLRTLQRDLSGRLSLDFPLQCDERQRPYRWSFATNTPSFDFPAFDTPTALAFVLARNHLIKVLPPSVLGLLEPHFDMAERQIESLEHNHLRLWVQRVRVQPNGKTLLPAEVANDVWSAVATALLEQRVVQVSYLSRSKGTVNKLCIHPAGLVSLHSVVYLLGTVEGFEDIRQFALHRMKDARCLDVPALRDSRFDIDQYVETGGFNNPSAVVQVMLVADVAPQVAWLLRETPISREQSLFELPGTSWQRLHATVPNDKQTFWWLFGLGEHIRVHEPSEWVGAITDRLEKMDALYRSVGVTSANARQEAL